MMVSLACAQYSLVNLWRMAISKDRKINLIGRFNWLLERAGIFNREPSGSPVARLKDNINDSVSELRTHFVVVGGKIFSKRKRHKNVA